MKKDYFVSLIKVLLLVFLLSFLMMIFLTLIIRHEFSVNARDKVVPFSVESGTFDKPLSFTLYPWSKYQQKNISELSEEQKAFIQQKQLAECMIEMTNYDDVLIQDKDSAVTTLYNDVRKLKTEDDREYFVWNQCQIEEIYIFAMSNMSGELFSFHYVTDLECDDEEAMEYVLENSNEDDDGNGIYSFDYEKNCFQENIDNFINSISGILNEYQNLNSVLFRTNIEFHGKADNFITENGNILLGYKKDTTLINYVYLYLDSTTKKISGYQTTDY